MRDEELQRVLQELDSALDVMRSRDAGTIDERDQSLRSGLAEIRRELAVYRAILQLRVPRKPN